MTDREKLIELIQSAVDGCATYWAGLIADHLMANGVTAQKHGWWVERSNPITPRYYTCSICGKNENHHTAIKGRYCWSCGAKMDLEVEDE